METTLLDLVFDITASILTHIVKHLTEDELQRVVAYLTSMRTLWVFYGLITVVTDIERGAVEMARLLGCIGIILTQLSHIGLRTEHTSNNKAMQRYALHLQTVEKCLTDVLQQDSGTGYQIGNTGVERVYIIIR